MRRTQPHVQPFCAAPDFKSSLIHQRTPAAWCDIFANLSPDAVVIDLDRLPSHGRELGLSLRASKSTSHLRLVFAGGVPEKIEHRPRQRIPDAIFTPWDNGVAAAIERAMAQPDPPRLPSRELPKVTGAGSLERKLDIKPQTHFAIIYANRNDEPWLEELLTSIPDGAVPQRRIDATTTLALFPVACAPRSHARIRAGARRRYR